MSKSFKILGVCFVLAVFGWTILTFHYVLKFQFAHARWMGWL